MQAVLMATHGKNWTEFPLLALVLPVAGIWGVKQGTEKLTLKTKQKPHKQ